MLNQQIRLAVDQARSTARPRPGLCVYYHPALCGSPVRARCPHYTEGICSSKGALEYSSRYKTPEQIADGQDA